MNLTRKQEIQANIKSSTYHYYKNTEVYFKDYIYGDRFYVTLEDVIYRFLVSDTNLEFEYTVGNIDIDFLVNDLYYHFIKTNKKFSEKNISSTERYRKNYIMKSLRNATEPLLIKQLKNEEVISQELDEFNNFKDLHYISIYTRDGGLLEDLSYKLWEKEKSEKEDRSIQINLLAEIFKYLNPLERKVVYLVLKNKTYKEIACILQVDQDKVRKIIYSSTGKLKVRHSFKRWCA